MISQQSKQRYLVVAAVLTMLVAACDRTPTAPSATNATSANTAAAPTLIDTLSFTTAPSTLTPGQPSLDLGTTTTTTTTTIAGGKFYPSSITDNGITYVYQVWVPYGFTTTKTYPVIFALHGANNRGSDNRLQISGGLASVIGKQATTWPAVTVFPQIPLGTFTSMTDMRNKVNHMMPLLRARILSQYRGDAHRVTLTGYSMGAILGWDVVYSDTAHWAGFVDVAGAICASCVTGSRTAPTIPVYKTYEARLKNMPIRSYHGSLDTNVPYQWFLDERTVWTQAGATKATWVPLIGQGHGIPDLVYGMAGVQTWLYSQYH